MKKSWSSVLLIVLAVSLSLACNLATVLEQGPPEEDVEGRVAATLTRMASIRKVTAARATSAQDLPSQTPQPSQTPAPTLPDTPTPSLTTTPTPSLTPQPAHLITPGSPTTRNTYISDLITVDYADQKTAVGDTYAWSRLERPYTAQDMAYQGWLDIMRVDLRVRDPWTYVTFVLIEALPESGDIRYAVELDTDHEGRGELLIMAALPSQTNWTTEGVRVMSDADGDVGGLFPLYEDAPDPDQNGYEQVLFSDGEGSDPDLAWVRRVPGQANQIQLAFKRKLLGTNGVFWSGWADAGLKDPGLFDVNDHFTFEEAGSPNKGNYRYPLKSVARIDSTCRGFYDFIPVGNEPGMCYIQEQYDPESPGLGYCIAADFGSGCGENVCREKCPAGELCFPCQLR